MPKFQLASLGWSAFFHEQLAGIETSGLERARVAIEHKGRYVVYAEEGEMQAIVSGRFRYRANSASDYPKVGDWVLVSNEGGRAIIHHLLQRRTKFSRKTAGEKAEEQMIAANIDVLNHTDGRAIDRYPRPARGAVVGGRERPW